MSIGEREGTVVLVSTIVAYYLYLPFIQPVQSAATGQNQTVTVSRATHATASRAIRTAT
jgi:hypothetical protein